MSYTVRLINFEGPLDLLLTLIERRDLPITDISISIITSDYIEYINQIDPDTRQLNWFSQLATQLALLKSRELSNHDLAGNDEPDLPLSQLAEQLKTYKKIKLASQHLSKLFTKPQFTRHSSNLQSTKDKAVRNLKISKLSQIYHSITKPQPTYFSHQISKRIPVKQKMTELMNQIDQPIVLSDIMPSQKSNRETIGILLAILELIKQRELILNDSSKGLVISKC